MFDWSLKSISCNNGLVVNQQEIKSPHYKHIQICQSYRKYTSLEDMIAVAPPVGAVAPPVGVPKKIFYSTRQFKIVKS